MIRSLRIARSFQNKHRLGATLVRLGGHWRGGHPFVVLASFGAVLAASAGIISVGCAGPGPKLFPMAPMAVSAASGGMTDLAFDTDGDGRVDYVERESADGAVALMRYDADQNGTFELQALPPALTGEKVRHLIMVLDSIPIELVRRAQQEGRFRLFYPPTRIIAPFPVMTDLSLAEFFGTSPTLGVESEYYRAGHLNGGWGSYARESISAWHKQVDYHMPYRMHGFSYTRPEAWYGHELRQIGNRFADSQENPFVGYVVGTSALGAARGYDGHRYALEKLDRFCHRIIQENHGRVQITLMSDHGHCNIAARRLDLRGALRAMGYRVRNHLSRPGDVVVPAFGIVSCAGVYTKEPQNVARNLGGVPGVDLAAYRDESGDVIVINPEGRGRISRRDDRYRYLAEQGDPLRLKPVIQKLLQEGKVATDGYVGDRILFDATVDHEWPDAVHRLWRAFHGLIINTPDVLVSINDDYCFGSTFMADFITIRAVHGNLGRISSSGFVMSTAGRVGDVIRMEDLSKALRKLGVPLSWADLTSR